MQISTSHYVQYDLVTYMLQEQYKTIQRSRLEIGGILNVETCHLRVKDRLKREKQIDVKFIQELETAN